MSKFVDYVQLDNVDVIINYIASYIITNDTICKCLKFNGIDALSQTLTDEDRDSLINNTVANKPNRRIYFQPFVNKTIDSQRTELRIYPYFKMENRVFAQCYIVFEICCHNDLWELDNSKFRTLVLLNELLKSLNGMDVNGIGLLNAENEKFPVAVFNDYFSGYTAKFCTRVT